MSSLTGFAEASRPVPEPRRSERRTRRRSERRSERRRRARRVMTPQEVLQWNDQFEAPTGAPDAEHKYEDNDAGVVVTSSSASSFRAERSEDGQSVSVEFTSSVNSAFREHFGWPAQDVRESLRFLRRPEGFFNDERMASFMLPRRRGQNNDFLDTVAIDRLPRKEWCAKDAETSDKPTCSICLGDYSIGDTLITLPCGHMNHVDCIVPWLGRRNVCPMCRQRIEEPESSDE